MSSLHPLKDWSLQHSRGGSLLRLHIDDAKRLAAVRDEAWEAIDPDTHRVVQPVNEPGTPRSLLKTQARGEILRPDGDWTKDSDNYGKLARLYDAGLDGFRDSTWALTAGDKTYKEWQTFIFR